MLRPTAHPCTDLYDPTAGDKAWRSRLRQLLQCPAAAEDSHLTTALAMSLRWLLADEVAAAALVPAEGAAGAWAHMLLTASSAAKGLGIKVRRRAVPYIGGIGVSGLQRSQGGGR